MTADGRLAGLGVAARFEGDRAFLDVRGDADARSVPMLSAFFDAVIASGCPSVILDLSEVDSIDAAGLAVAASAAGTLVASGGHLTIRSSSGEVARAFDLAGLSGLIGLEIPAATPKSARGDLRVPGSISPISPNSSDPGGRTSAISAIPANEDVVDGVLRLVVALAEATVGGADGASVTLRRHGRLMTVAASDQTVLDMDADQYATQEGPCIDAAVAGRRFHAESLDEETRWPAFTPKARTLGIQAILSSPLLARDQPMGALNIYSHTPRAFAARGQGLAAMFAAEASNVLTLAGTDVTEDELTGRVQGALRTREIIAEAQGIIMEREDIGDKEAFDVMRRSSRSSGQPLRETARDVVNSTHRTNGEIRSERSGERHG
jgi:anti-anti-sigma factor